jgi:hypothetical protein
MSKIQKVEIDAEKMKYCGRKRKVPREQGSGGR